MKQEHFADARLLVSRAQSHIDELEAGIKRFLTDEPWTTIVEPNVEKAEYTHKLRLAKRFDPNLKTIAADAANNLRSALDHVASECGRLNGATNIKNIHFPFRPTIAEFQAALAHKSLKMIPSQILTYFGTLKPYKGGNDRLYMLTQISARNKHWSLTPMFADTHAIKIFFPDGDIRLVQTMGWSASPEKDVVLFTSPKPNENYEYHVSFTVYFDGVGLRPKPPPVPTLRYLAGMINDVINDCEIICQRLGLL